MMSFAHIQAEPEPEGTDFTGESLNEDLRKTSTLNLEL